jgi:serralysin
MRTTIRVIALLVGTFFATSAHAAHHLWALTEIYSNASGSTQFVEMFCPDANEQGLGPFTLASTTHSINFVTNLPSAATANTWVLAATSNFAGLPGGITPDYIIPANFFPTGGGTINYASGTNTWNYGVVPTDGVNALQRNGSSSTNSPHNFAGASGSVNLGTVVPATNSWGLIALVGAVLLLASGLLRRRSPTAAA